jgi:hypothetical protein
MQSSNFSFGGYRDTVEKLFYSARRSDGKLASTEKGSEPISKLTSAGTQYLFDAADGVVIVLMRRRSCCWNASLHALLPTPRGNATNVDIFYLLFQANSSDSIGLRAS